MSFSVCRFGLIFEVEEEKREATLASLAVYQSFTDLMAEKLSLCRNFLRYFPARLSLFFVLRRRFFALFGAIREPWKIIKAFLPLFLSHKSPVFVPFRAACATVS